MSAKLDRIWWTLLILVGAFALRLYRLDSQSIWWDEGHSILMASAPIAQIPTLPGMDVHPPGYFVILHQWLVLAGRSEFGLRYLSVVFSVLTVALAMRFAQLLSAGAQRLNLRLLVGTLTALSPLYVAYAQEVRMYALVTFWALASVHFLWRISFGPSSPGRWKWLAYVFVTAASLYTHYFTVFLLLFENLVWLVWVWRGRSVAGRLQARLGWWFSSQAAIIILFAPQLLLAFRQITTYFNPNLVPPTLVQFGVRSWQAYTVGLTIPPAWARWGMIGATVALIVAAVPLAGQRPKSGGGRVVANPVGLFLVSWLLLPLASYFLILQRQPSFEPRYMMLVTPALFLLLAYGLSEIGARRLWGSVAASVGLGLLVASFTLGLVSYFTQSDYFKDDSAAVAAWLAMETTANDVVLVDVPHPFHYYAAREQIPAPTEYFFVDIHTAASELTARTAGRARLFWVTWPRGDTDPRGVVPFLAQKQGQPLGQVAFRGYRVDWYSLSGRDFSLPDELGPVSVELGEPGATVMRLDGLAFGGPASQGRAVSAAKTAWVTMHFRLLRPTDLDYRVSVRLRAEDGSLAAQLDKDLLNDRHFRTSAWPLDDERLNQAINVYTLPLAPDAGPGIYSLEVVVYDAVTLTVLPVTGDPGGAAEPGTAAVGRLEILPK
jgi:uncharacterized membrane protein